MSMQLAEVTPTIKNIEKLLATDKVREALESLLELLTNLEKHKELRLNRESVIVNSATLHRVTEAFNMQVISWEENSMTKNRIIMSTLQALDALRSNPFIEESAPFQQEKALNLNETVSINTQRHLVGAVVFALALSLFFVLADQVSGYSEIIIVSGLILVFLAVRQYYKFVETEAKHTPEVKVITFEASRSQVNESLAELERLMQWVT